MTKIIGFLAAKAALLANRGSTAFYKGRKNIVVFDKPREFSNIK